MLSVLAAACAGGDNAGFVTEREAQPGIVALAVSPPSAVLIVGDSLALSAVADGPSAATSISYAFSSNNSAVASVSSTGRVVAISPGAATITVVATSTGTTYATATLSRSVEIRVDAGAPAIVDLQVSPEAVSLTAGASQQLVALANQPPGAPPATLSFLSSQPTVATVDQSGRVTAVSPGTATITVSARSPRGFGFAESQRSRLVTVNVQGGEPGIVFFEVTPGTLALRRDQSTALQVTVTRRAGVPDASLSFSSSASAVASVNASGVVTGGAPGAATITVTAATPAAAGYSASTRSQQLQVSVSQAESGITSLAVTPSSATLGVQEVRQIVAVPVQPAGAPAASISFATSSAAVVNVTSSGLLTAVAPGTATITVTATSPTVSAFAGAELSQSIAVTVEARAAGISGLVLQPPSSELQVGASASWRAVVTQPEGAPAASVSYRSSSPSVASVDDEGNVTALSVGTATIFVTATSAASARFEPTSLERSASLTVRTAGISSATITPTNAVLAVGASQPLTINVSQPSGAPSAVWTFTSSNSAVATVAPSGLVTAVAPGNAAISWRISTPAMGSYAASELVRTVNVTVTQGTPAISGIQAVPSATTLQEGTGLTVPIVIAQPSGAPAATLSVSSSAPAVLSVTSSAASSLAVAAVAPGTAVVTVRASSPAAGTFVASVQEVTFALTVVAAPQGISSFTVSPSSLSISAGAQSALSWVVNQPGGAPVASLSFVSSNPLIASVSPTGVITAVGVGSTSIVATASSASATGFRAATFNRTVAVTVSAPPPAITALTVTPTTVTRFPGQTASLTVSATQPAGAAQAAIVYTSSNPAIASVNSAGVVSALAAGSSTISITATAASGGGFGAASLTRTVSVTVQPPQAGITSFSVSPSSISMVTTGSAQLVPSLSQPSGAPTASISYSSSAPTVATVSSTGQISALTVGTATLTATATSTSAVGFTASSVARAITVTVSAAPPAISSFTVSPTSSTLLVGSTRQITRSLSQPVGASAAVVSYASSAPGVASVSGSGLITASTAGTATISVTASASAGGGFAAATIVRNVVVTVTTPQPGISAISVSPNPLQVLRLGTAQLVVQQTRPPGAPTATVVYSSSNSSVATVSASGVVTGRAVGSAVITVTASTSATTGFTAASVQATVPVSVAFVETFASGLGRWSSGDAAWRVDANGRLEGSYNIGCGSPSCPQSSLVLADSLQPQTPNWRATVQFFRINRLWNQAYNLTSAYAWFSLVATANEKAAVSLGRGTNESTSGPLPTTSTTVDYGVQTFTPWTLRSNGTVTVSQWNTAGPNTATLEKQGTTYRLYFNGTLVHTFQQTFSVTPKIGLHSYGMVLMDNFELVGIP